jgi:signal transduction histidine kinase
MTASDLPLEVLRRELTERLFQAEQRTRALESIVMRGEELAARRPLHETPTPGSVETPRPAPRPKQQPAELRSDAVLSAVIASLDDVIWSASPDGDRVYVLTGGVEATHGRPAAEFLEHQDLWLGIVAAADREAVRAAFLQLPQTGRFHIDYDIQLPTGSMRRVTSRGKLIRSQDGQPLRVDGITSPAPCPAAGRIDELETRLAEAESRSQESGRLETVGRMLAGAAHDFNNLLTIVTGHAELVRETLMPDDPLREPVELIASSGHAAARVARQLVAYAKPAATADALDCNAALRDCEPMLRSITGLGIEVDFLLTPGIAPIRAGRGDFDRVVLNLVVNARDAIDETGAISVRTAAATVMPGRRGWPADCPPGDYIALTVTDTGCGMTEEIQAQAFTRFFTTKGTKGTGLGLAAVRDIVTAAGGHVELESSPQWGTSVRVFWPVAANSDEPIRISMSP